MNPATDSTVTVPASRAGTAAYFMDWLHDLGTLRAGGFMSDEEYAMQRAERLEELLTQPRCLWLGTVIATLPLAVPVGLLAWWQTLDWQLTAAAAGLAALFGIVMFSRAARAKLKQLQLASRVEILRQLLAAGLIDATEFIAYEDRLSHGQVAMNY